MTVGYPQNIFFIIGQTFVLQAHAHALSYIPINYAFTQIYNQPNMSKKTAERSQPFLQKFQDKKTAVGKEGLIHLLEQKLQTSTPTKRIKSHGKVISQQAESHPPTLKKKQLAPLTEINSPIVGRETHKPHQSQRYSLHKQQTSSQQLPSRKTQTLHLKQQKSQQLLGNKVRLPSINKNEGQSLHSRNVPISQPNKQTKSGQLKSLQQSGQSESMLLKNFDKQLNLDSYALKHLQTLDRFEQMLIKQKLENATRSALSEQK